MTRRALLAEEPSVWSPLLARALRAAGVEPVPLASPERLPDLARQLRPDLIFLDERLRAARESDRIAALKLDPATCDLAVVLVAAGRRGPEPGLAAEPDERLPRHFGRLDVQAALARLERRRAERRRLGVRREL